MDIRKEIELITFTAMKCEEDARQAKNLHEVSFFKGMQYCAERVLEALDRIEEESK